MSDRMPRGGAIEDALVAQMHRDLTRRPWYKRWQWRLGMVGVGALVVGAGTFAGTTLLTHEEVTDTSWVQCLSEAQLNPDGSLPAHAATVASPDGMIPIDDAKALCAQMWEAGVMTSADPLDASPSPGVVPSEFTVCVGDDGEAVVAPGRIACSTLRLHPYQP